MSDDGTSYPSLDAALDKAIGAAIDDAPNPQDAPNVVQGRHAAFDKMEEEEGKGGKAKGQKGNKHDEKGRQKADQTRGLDDSIDKAQLRASERAKEKAATDVRSKAGKESVYSSNRNDDDKLVGGILDRAFSKVGERPKPLDTKEFAKKDMRELRTEIKGRYSGAKLSEIMKRFEGWEAEFRANPTGARERIVTEYLRFSPQNYKKGEAKEYAGGIDGAVQRAFDDREDLEDLKEYAEKYGEHLPHIMRQLVEFDRGMIDDPVGTSARLAANYGALEPQAQQPPQSQQQASQAAQSAPAPVPRENVEKALGIILATKGWDTPGDMPDMDDAMMHRIAEVFENNMIRRTGNHEVDFKAAYKLVSESNAGALGADEQARAKGSKSIHGAPSGSSVGKRRGGKGGSLDDSINRAFGGV